MNVGKSLGIAALGLASWVVVADAKIGASSNPYYDEPTGAAALELADWSTLYLARAESGVPAVGAYSFAFTDSRMNSALYSPLSGALRTVGVATAGSAGATCFRHEELSLLAVSRTAFVENLASYVESRTVSTSTLDTGASSSHQAAVLAAMLDGHSVSAGVQGGAYVSVGLPVTEEHTGGAVGEYAELTDEILDWIYDLEGEAKVIADELSGGAGSLAVLTGEVSLLSEFESEMSDFLVASGLTEELTPYGVEAWFGLRGSLPILVVVSDDGFVLIDALTGQLDGPFEPGSVIDPTGLLLGHPGAYVSGTGYSVVDAGTLCAASDSQKWRSTPPSGWTPNGATPGTPSIMPEGRPTHWGDYSCKSNVGGRCICTSQGKGTVGSPPTLVKTRVTCICSPAEGGGCTTATGHPNIPPGSPTPPGGLGGNCECTQTWLY